MHQIVIESTDTDAINQLADELNQIEQVDVIIGKNFSGEITNLEIYLPLITNVILAITPILTAFIEAYFSNRKSSSITIDGEKIEVSNVSPKLVEKVLKQHFEANQSETEKHE